MANLIKLQSAFTFQLMRSLVAVFYIVISLCLILFSRVSMAAGEQFYFIGMVAPIESISQHSGAQAVYLRWDEIEGHLPADLAQIILQRNGTEIYRSAANKTPDAAEIKAFYAGDVQKRRRLEMINGLNQVAASETPTRTITQSNFANEIVSKIQTDRFWAVLASRLDFNIARARGRGFLDNSVSAGTHEYELIGESTSQEKIRLGRVTVNTAVPSIVAASPDFSQVKDLARCDAPEFGKQHGSVALNWDHAGANATDHYINGLMIAGFDIYRAVDAGPVDASMNIRQLAASQGHDAQGLPDLPGLTKLNELAIMLGGTAQRETTNQGWNPEFSKFLETYPEILAAGLNVGDKRAYYLVPRDITGNYGMTAGLEVEIPDSIAPPAPWDVHQITDLSAPAAQAFRLRFSAVNVANYVNDNAYGRRWCNLDRARLDKRLRFVASDQQCETAPQREVDLGAKTYLVYRFAGIEQAKSFSDSDGDGYSDLDERIVNADNPLLSDPGTACTVNGPGLGFENFLITSIPGNTGVSTDDGRKVIDFIDPVPANDRGQIFWYRFATQGADGKTGHLSEPVRGHFPDRKRGDRIIPDGKGDDVIGVLECDYEINATKIGSQSIPFAQDTTGDASWMRMSCVDVNTQNRGQGGVLTLPIIELENGRGAELSPASCRQYAKDCSAPDKTRRNTVAYLDAQGKVLAEEKELLFKIDKCPTGNGSILTKPEITQLPPAGVPSQCKNPRIRPIEPGEILEPEDVGINLPTDPTSCVVISRDIGGQSYRIAQFCPPFSGVPELPLDGLAGGTVCLSVSYSNENNELSVPYQIPCFTLAPTEAPDTPQIYQLKFSDTQMSVNFRPPEQPVAGTLFEWYQKGSNSGRASAFKSHPGNSQADGSLDIALTIAAEPVSGADWQQEWCVRGRSVGTAPMAGGQDGNLSQWSPELCAIRLPAGELLPEYLPWPRIPAPNEAGGLISSYLEIDGIPVIQLGEPLDLNAKNCSLTNIPACSGSKNACLPAKQDVQVMNCRASMCVELRSKMKGSMGFVVYRQTASDEPASSSAEPSEFVQISPLIDHINCVDFPLSDSHISALVDPYLSLIDFSLSSLDDVRVYFTDEVPHVALNWYRYQLVYFDKQGEILNYRNTQWIKAK